MSQENKVNIGIGDIVKVTANNCGHQFAIGELVKVVRINETHKDVFLCESNSGVEYWLNIYNCELIERCKDRQIRGAAPELLEACKMALHVFDMEEIIRTPGTVSNKLYNAIKKATE